MAKALPTLGLIFLLTVFVTVFHGSESQDNSKNELTINSRDSRSVDVDNSDWSRKRRSSSSSGISSSSGKCGKGKGKGKGSTSEGFLGDCCEIDADCNAQLALQCIDNTCQCLPGHVNINETCTLLSCIGEPCNITDQCKGENVECDEELGICLCSDGFLLTQDGQCVNRSSELCDSCTNDPDSCAPEFQCGESGLCECPDELPIQIGFNCYGRYYNESCNTQVPTCIENFMECNDYTGLCDCENPYVWNGSICVGGYLGDPCDPILALCAANGFVCGDSYQCQCPDGEVQVGDQCFSLLCGDCVMDTDCFGANQICVNNSCTCESGYYTDSCGACQAKLPDDSECTADAECLSNTCLCDVCVPADSDDCCNDCDEIIADLIIITDNSGSVGSTDYETEKAFAISLVNAFDISPTETRVGWIDYSSGVNVAINMNSANFDNNLEVTSRLCQQPFLSGATRTDLALQQATNFLESSTNRPNVTNYVVLITDGVTNAGGEAFVDTRAAELNAIPDTEVFVVGIGSNLNTTQLNGIASDPSNVYNAAFDSLDDLINTILEDICANN